MMHPSSADDSLQRVERKAPAARDMWYDVALADLEIAPLLLAENRTAEVKQMARELVAAFEARNVHREALAARREAATVELALRAQAEVQRLGREHPVREEASRAGLTPGVERQKPRRDR